MKEFDRMLRVNELIRRELSMLCERELTERFPALVTITKVDTATNLRNAIVYFSVLNSDENVQREILHILQGAHARLQAEMAANIKLKYTPVLKFKIDNSMCMADNVFAIIRELHLDETEPGGGADPDDSDVNES